MIKEVLGFGRKDKSEIEEEMKRAFRKAEWNFKTSSIDRLIKEYNTPDKQVALVASIDLLLEDAKKELDKSIEECSKIKKVKDDSTFTKYYNLKIRELMNNYLIIQQRIAYCRVLAEARIKKDYKQQYYDLLEAEIRLKELNNKYNDYISSDRFKHSDDKSVLEYLVHIIYDIRHCELDIENMK